MRLLRRTLDRGPRPPRHPHARRRRPRSGAEPAARDVWLAGPSAEGRREASRAGRSASVISLGALVGPGHRPRHAHSRSRRPRPAPDVATLLVRWYPEDEPPTAVGAGAVAGAMGAREWEAAGSEVSAPTGTAQAAATPRASRSTRSQRRRRVTVVAATLGVLAVVAGGTGGSFATSAGSAPTHSGRLPAGGNSLQAALHPALDLPAATSKPAPAPPSLAGAPPLASHEIFGYAPYWTLPQSSSFDVADLTTLAYFSVDANGDGSLDQSGAGWNGYESQDLANLVTRAHGAGDRVVLTVTCFSQSALNQITSDPRAPATLASALVGAVSAKNLDGVNFDLQGEGSGDRAGLTSLITQGSQALHAANPHWQVTMATYASAAGDSAGFYDIAALAPAVDGFFVMAYDMNDRSEP